MPYEGVGLRHSAICTKQVKHGAICEENGFVGTAFKTAQLGRFVDPSTSAATDILVGESFEIQLGGIHEAVRSGNLATADVGAAAVSDVYINTANNALGLAAQGLAAAVLNAGWKKVGKVTARDATRNPQVVRINSNFVEFVRGNDV